MKANLSESEEREMEKLAVKLRALGFEKCSQQGAQDLRPENARGGCEMPDRDRKAASPSSINLVTDSVDQTCFPLLISPYHGHLGLCAGGQKWALRTRTRPEALFNSAAHVG